MHFVVAVVVVGTDFAVAEAKKAQYVELNMSEVEMETEVEFVVDFVTLTFAVIVLYSERCLNHSSLT